LLASEKSGYVLAMDADAYCIENLYADLKKNNKNNTHAERSRSILPLNMNLSNPSPGLGWANNERSTIAQRGKADMLLALALLHHLRIGNNAPFKMIAEYFSSLASNLIIEFIPKEDSNVKLMMAGRENNFNDYTEENFISAFEIYFNVEEKHLLPGTGRILYLLIVKN
jgi:hypothetical protein